MIYWKTVLSLPPKPREAHFAFLDRPSAQAQSAGDRSAKLEEAVSRILEQANERIDGKGDTAARQTLLESRQKGEKQATTRPRAQKTRS